MHIHTRLLVVPIALTALAIPGRASVPGNIPQQARAGLVHVCEDNEPDDGPTEYIVCLEHEGGDDQAPHTGSECVTAGLPATCVVDLVPKVKLKGKITLVHDDAALDQNGDVVIGGQTALILELKKGPKKRTFFDLFAGDKIGNWNNFGAEPFLTNIASGITFQDGVYFQFASQNITDLGEEIRAQAAVWSPKADLVGAVPVVTALSRDKKDPIDADEFEQKLGSAAFLKIELQFARAVP
jgi:hypothetical protein